MTEPIRINPGSDAEVRLWRAAAEVARLFADWPWVLVGGLMVAILEREHGVTVSRATVDVDLGEWRWIGCVVSVSEPYRSSTELAQGPTPTS